jgi:hypothetical protein
VCKARQLGWGNIDPVQTARQAAGGGELLEPLRQRFGASVTGVPA